MHDFYKYEKISNVLVLFNFIPQVLQACLGELFQARLDLPLSGHEASLCLYQDQEAPSGDLHWTSADSHAASLLYRPHKPSRGLLSEDVRTEYFHFNHFLEHGSNVGCYFNLFLQIVYIEVPSFIILFVCMYLSCKSWRVTLVWVTRATVFFFVVCLFVIMRAGRWGTSDEAQRNVSLLPSWTSFERERLWGCRWSWRAKRVNMQK